LYSTLDALNTLDYFGRAATYRKKLELVPGIDVTFYDAGHILGASSIGLNLNERGEHRRLLFSGDIGNSATLLLDADNNLPASDIVIMETTYGDREHRPAAQSIAEFYEAINSTFSAGGNVIIPTFALERAQELLFCLREGRERKHLPGSLQVFLDSPMAISATEIFQRHPECYGGKLQHFLDHKRDPFRLPGLHFCRDTADSIALNRISGGAIIMAGSGMCNGGRVIHHLRHNLWRRECSIVFVGFAARETLARQIIDGAKTVRIFGEVIPVHARIYTINGFSAHAGQSELLDWHRRTGKPEKTFLVHGEESVMEKFAPLLRGTEVFIPTLHAEFAL
jgi:metallo-beta-lactamase family protein